MKRCEFERLVIEQLNRCKDVLTKKGQEYAAFDGDRLEHFHIAARMLGVTSVEALMGMKVKHTASIAGLVKSVASGRTIIRSRVDEKFTDEINYLLLLRALIEDEGKFAPEV